MLNERLINYLPTIISYILVLVLQKIIHDTILNISQQIVGSTCTNQAQRFTITF